MVITLTLALCWIYGILLYFSINSAFQLTFFWHVQGLRRILVDVRFMLRMGLGIYWKFTWSLFIPVALLGIFIYAMVSYQPMKTDDGNEYPAGVTGMP